MIYREDPTACIGMVIFRSGDFVAVELNGSCRCYTCAELFGEGYRLELTDIEKQKLFDAMKKNGKRWNAEKKVVEDIPKPIPKPYEFRKGEPVLVRDYDDSFWKLAAFGKRSGDANYPYEVRNERGNCYCYRKCIPYNERTMHLLGTTEDYKEGE